MKKRILFVIIVLLSFANVNAQCNYSIVLTDDWGDGWQGGQVEIIVAGVSVGTYTLGSGSGPETYYFSVQTNDQIYATYTAGSYPQENEYHIYDADNLEIFSDGTGGNPPTANNTLVGLGNCPSCPPPFTLFTSNIQLTTASVNWTEVGSATEWNIEYGPTGFTQGTGTLLMNITTNPYNLTSLLPAITYDWYVRSVCGSGDTSNWMGPETFTTQCTTLFAPYAENFENGGIIPACWTNDIGDDIDWEFGISTPSPNTGPQSGDHTSGTGYFAFIESTNPNFPDKEADLLSPWIDVSTLTQPCLSFWYNLYGSTMGELHVDINDGTWQNDVFTISGNQGDVWVNVIVNLSSYTSPVQVRFRGITGTNYMSDMAIDDVSFEEMPICPSPTSLSATNITENSTDLTWVETGSATIWNIKYGLAGFVQGSGTLLTGITSNPYTLTGLTPLTDYEFYIMSDCGGGDSSNWVGPFAFTTLTMPLSNPSLCEVGIEIPDNDCINQPIEVIAPGTQLGTDIFLSDVNIIIEHPSDMNLTFTLKSPNGVIVNLSMQNGGWGGANYGIVDGTCAQYTNFNMIGIDGNITAGAAPFLGSYIPEGDFNDFNDGSNPNGLWTIQLCDQWNGNIGTLEYIELVFEQILPPVIMEINEIDVTQGSSDTAEFVEIYDGGFGNFPLDDYCLVFYDGDGDTVYAAYDLDGYLTDTNGYFVIGDSGVANVQMILPDSIQDGADAIVLYQDTSASFPIGFGITTNNILDAVVYSTDDPFDLQLLQLLNSGQPQINENVLGKSYLHSLSRLPNGTGNQQNTNTYYVSIPTPGDSNIAIPLINWNDSIFSESIVNDGSIANNITINLENDYFAHSGIFTDGVEFVSENLPTGLTAQVNILSDTVATISLLGNATAHMDSNNVNNLKISFTNQAFFFGDTIYCKNFFNDSIKIDFMDAPPPQMIWDTLVFYEDSINHGGISNNITLHLINAQFSVDTGILTDSIFYTTANVPQGLSVQISVLDSENVEISLIGNAIYNNDSNDVANLSVHFLDTAFAGFSAAEVINSSYDSLKIDFYDGLSDSTEILSFSFALELGPAVINHINHTVDIEVNEFADLGYLVPTFILSTGATSTISGIPQISGTTANNYNGPVIYNVLAEDTVTNQDWIVTVTHANAIEEEDLNGLRIFPNPTDDKLNIICSQKQISEIQLIAVTGETILQFDASNKQTVFILSLKSVPSGVYSLKLNIDNEIIYRKIVITK